MAGGVEHLHQRFRLLTDQGQGDAEQNGDEQHLKNVVTIRDRRDQRGRNDVHQEAGERPVMRLLLKFRDLPRIQRRRIDIEPSARMHDIGDDQPDDQRQGGESEKVSKGLRRHPPNRAQLLHARDAGDDGEEDDRRNDHLHQLDEGIAKRLERYSRLREEVADENADGNRRQHLYVKLLVKRQRRDGFARCIMHILHADGAPCLAATYDAHILCPEN